ncbi:MAG: PEP/pyruvate-binding domain-containing protein [Spirochaetales bacterium]|uniref:PEP/pyruvate-binding domain-containing protein n=1 Tax=Candidatus Thalassospirochaeta sargassi TaxID=3119039 RepID=A0AAJ1IEQ7_9SPIO|nr:PEP/pyruvate-binding domain-containing protein [Spirochaetales bacterium]
MKNNISYIGIGSPGGKGAGLIRIQSLIDELYPEDRSSSINLIIPEMTIILSDVFGQFISENNLSLEQVKDKTDEEISRLFQQSSFPPLLVGELRKISNRISEPLAVRSSSFTEDSLNKPLAGLFATKMIPNNSPDPNIRFMQLINAVKFVYSSTWFSSSRDSFQAAGFDLSTEMMSVIIQRVHGQKHGQFFLPAFSGVGRSFNYYPFGGSAQESGIIELAAGLGKTIVDGGRKWLFCPENPGTPPPASMKAMLDSGQTHLWTIDLKPPEKESPLDEDEFLTKKTIKLLEEDEIIRFLCSTYSPESDRLEMGFQKNGFKLIDFSPILKGGLFGFNNCMSHLLKDFSSKINEEIEIEFAVNINLESEELDLALLQIRPMKKLNSAGTPSISSIDHKKIIVSSNNALGNLFLENIIDFVYILPSVFSARNTAEMPLEIERINRTLISEGRSYVLCGFGRWGSSDPALGIPVKWSQISGARVIIESTLPDMNPDLSQGSHFFHNILNTETAYLSIDNRGMTKESFIDFEYLEKQCIIFREKYFTHVRLNNEIKIIVDGKKSEGVIYYE